MTDQVLFLLDVKFKLMILYLRTLTLYLDNGCLHFCGTSQALLTDNFASLRPFCLSISHACSGKRLFTWYMKTHVHIYGLFLKFLYNCFGFGNFASKNKLLKREPWFPIHRLAYIYIMLQALIYREFFSQGDLEKALGQKPSEMMDRERARIPDLQIGFLDHIALPVYRSV